MGVGLGTRLISAAFNISLNSCFPINFTIIIDLLFYLHHWLQYTMFHHPNWEMQSHISGYAEKKHFHTCRNWHICSWWHSLFSVLWGRGSLESINYMYVYTTTPHCCYSLHTCRSTAPCFYDFLALHILKPSTLFYEYYLILCQVYVDGLFND